MSFFFLREPASMKNSVARTPRGGGGFGSIFNDQASSVSRINSINRERFERKAAGSFIRGPYRYRPDYMAYTENDDDKNIGNCDR